MDNARRIARSVRTLRADTSLLRALTVAAAVAAYGLSYGVLAVAAGLSPRLATLSSALVFAGASQFAFIGVSAVGGNPLMGALSGLLLNTRYLAFGFAIAPHLSGAGRARRALDSYLLADESVAIGLAPGPDSPVRRCRPAGWAILIAWIGATALGAYGGALIGDPRTLGLDAAFPAGFLALLAPWLRTPHGRLAAIVGAGVAVALLPWVPTGLAIVAASAGAVAALPLARRHGGRVAS